MGRRKNIYKHVSSLKPRRSQFDLSYSKKLTCDMGELIPIMCDEVVPGDLFKIANQALIRTQALVAPFMHQVNVYTHYYFVPLRLLGDARTREKLSETFDWESFITGGVDGDDTQTQPTWNPTTHDEGSLWDYLGFPLDIDCAGCYPLDWPRRAYNFIYNEYYRDETLQDEVDLDNEDILLRGWEKDYFTSAQPSQQRGTALALPISGTTSAEWDTSLFVNSTGGTPINVPGTVSQPWFVVNGANDRDNAFNTFNDNSVDLSTATTFDVSDIRLVFQIQKWMERNQRAGARYTEFLKSHFGVSPHDARLDRPEYIGGSKSPIIVSEVLQTSSTDVTTPQGNLAGHGITVQQQFCGKYHVQEYGLIMGIMSIMPKPDYQQGINRQWLRETRYDYYFPEFANLSEQAILNAELFVTDGNASTNQTIFGYQGRYDELRTKQNMICAGMRDTFDYWHVSRQFSSVPSLNSDFIECDPRKDIFAVTGEDGFLVEFGNLIIGYRPIPITAEPGLIDHN